MTRKRFLYFAAEDAAGKTHTCATSRSFYRRAIFNYDGSGQTAWTSLSAGPIPPGTQEAPARQITREEYNRLNGDAP
jgi:hypothetical protein